MPVFSWRWLALGLLLAAAGAHAKPWKSTEMITRQEFKYGAFEARIRGPQGSGQIAAFFLWKHNSEVPGAEWQEQDFEVFGKDGNYQTQIMTPGNPRTENNTYHQLYTKAWENYYTYRMEWTPDYLAFYVDGYLVRLETDRRRFAKLLDPARAEPAQLRISLWAGDGGWSGAFDESAAPGAMYVEYLATYSYTPDEGENGSDFTRIWRDEFNTIDTNRWWFANWTFSSSVTDYIRDNVAAINGKAVFILTDEANVGRFPSNIPADNPPLPAPERPLLGYVSDHEPVQLPGRVQAEAYYGYYDNTQNNLGDAACSDTAVDAQITTDGGGGCVTAYAGPGEWLDYRVEVPETGLYRFVVRAASHTTDNGFNFTLNGDPVSPARLRGEGLGIKSFSDIVFTAELPAGSQTLRLNFLSTGININYFDILRVDAPPPEEPVDPADGVAIPARIEAEDFVSAFDTTSGNLGGNACSTGDVDSQRTGDSAGGGCNIAWTEPGEWLEYVVVAPQAGDYDLTLRLATVDKDKSVRVQVNGKNVGSSLFGPGLGYQTYRDVPVSIPLTAGANQVRIVIETGRVNINYLEIDGPEGGLDPVDPDPVDPDPVDPDPVDPDPVDPDPVDPDPVDPDPVDPDPVDPGACSPTVYRAQAINQTTGGARDEGWNIWTNGNVNVDHPFRNPFALIQVVAYGELAGDDLPRMVVRVGNTVVGEVEVGNTSYADFFFEAGDVTGERNVSVAFANDYVQGDKDRNLIVERIEIDDCF